MAKAETETEETAGHMTERKNSSDVFLKMFIARGGFDIVANFSAHKHVRSEKDIYFLEALFTNNVFHAQAFLELLGQYPSEAFSVCRPTMRPIPST